MKTKSLGKSPFVVSEICLGGNVFGWTIDEKSAFGILDGFQAAGGNFVDTANIYSNWKPGNQGGESETIIGNWMKERGNRSKMIIATKVGMQMASDKMGLSAKYIEHAVEASLKRLQTDYIDLYIAHSPDISTPISETMGAFARLVKAGKVRAVGASNYSSAQLLESEKAATQNGFPRFESLQPHYNLFDRAGFEGGLEATCSEMHVGVTPYYSLASGFLTGKYRGPKDFGKSPRGGAMTKYLTDRGLRILKALDDVSAKHGTNPTAISLAWLKSRPSVTAPIASATSKTQLDDLIGAAKVNLDSDSLGLLDRASREV